MRWGKKKKRQLQFLCAYIVRGTQTLEVASEGLLVLLFICSEDVAYPVISPKSRAMDTNERTKKKKNWSLDIYSQSKSLAARTFIVIK